MPRIILAHTPASTFTTYATLAMNCLTIIVDATIPTPSFHTLVVTASMAATDKSITTPARMPVGQNSANVVVIAPGNTPVTSRGCKELLVITVRISLLFTFALF